RSCFQALRALPSFPTLSDLSDPISSVLSGPELNFSGPSGGVKHYQAFSVPLTTPPRSPDEPGQAEV
ncbi:hypothetical protein AB0M64_33735, partial [Streptomyces sp. NPDC051771]